MGFACFVVKHKINHGGHQGSKKIREGPGKTFFELFGQCFEHFVVKKDLTTEDTKVCTKFTKGEWIPLFEPFEQYFECFVVKKRSIHRVPEGCSDRKSVV